MKNNDHKELDQVLKDRLSEGSTHVPDFVWDRIEEELFPKKKRRGFFWWFFGALCFLIMAILFGIAFSGEKVHSQHVSLSQHSVSKPSNASASRNETPVQKTLNPTKTKGCSQYRDHATKKRKTTKSSFTVITLKPEQQSSKFVSKKSKLSISSRHPSFKKIIHSSPILERSNAFDLTRSNPIKKEEQSPSSILLQKTRLLDSTAQSIIEHNSDSQAKLDSSGSKELSYEEVLALAKRDFSERPDKLKETKPNSFFSLGIYGGSSIYHSAVFKDYFTSGQLSQRTFASSGFELGFQARFKISKRFRIYTGFAFNQKQTQFNYNLAITETDYFTYLAKGEKVPFENIRDDGANSCFLAKDVHAKYQIQSMLFSLGTNFEFLKIGKFSMSADFRLSCNVYSALHLEEIRVVDIQQPDSESFSYLQPGAGLSLDVQLNQRISLGLSPFFSKQFYVKESFSHKLNELVVPFTVSIHL